MYVDLSYLCTVNLAHVARAHAPRAPPWGAHFYNCSRRDDASSATRRRADERGEGRGVGGTGCELRCRQERRQSRPNPNNEGLETIPSLHCHSSRSFCPSFTQPGATASGENRIEALSGALLACSALCSALLCPVPLNSISPLSPETRSAHASLEQASERLGVCCGSRRCAGAVAAAGAVVLNLRFSYRRRFLLLSTSAGSAPGHAPSVPLSFFRCP